MTNTNMELVRHSTDSSPTEYNPKIVADLIVAFQNDYDITGACGYAKISRSTYYDWNKDKEGFAEKMTNAQNHLLQKASEVIAKAINEGDTKLAFKFLQTRDPRYKDKGFIEMTETETLLQDIIKNLTSDRSLIPVIRNQDQVPIGDDSEEI